MNEIEVKVTANRSRKYFIMYWRDPVSDVREERSTKKTKRRDALAWLLGGRRNCGAASTASKAGG